MCISNLSTNFVWHISSFQDELRDMVKLYIGLHVKYPLFLYDFQETSIFSTDSRKIPKYQISWKIRSLRAKFFRADRQMDRRTDITKLIVTLNIQHSYVRVSLIYSQSTTNKMRRFSIYLFL